MPHSGGWREQFAAEWSIIFKDMNLSPEVIEKVSLLQRHEATEEILYKRLAARARREEDKKVLLAIARQEHEHYEVCRALTGRQLPPLQGRLWLFTALTTLFGLHFSIRLMERTEISVGDMYKSLVAHDKRFAKILADEEGHEQAMLDLLSKHNLVYTSSVVLGLNDALVEMIGVLAGLTFAFQNSALIAAAALITGVAASLSMAASSYLATKEETPNRKIGVQPQFAVEPLKDPLRGALYTGGAYLVTVAAVVAPYFFFENPQHALVTSLGIVIGVIASFNFYISVAKNQSFARKFATMLLISLGTAGVTYLIGTVVRSYLHVAI